MSRSGYSEDYDGDGVPPEFYRQAVVNATNGKRGQRFFRDLLASLDAMPEKRLIADDLVAQSGEVCALGALGLARGIDMTKLDPDDAYSVGPAFGIAESLAREVVFENDEHGPIKSFERTCTVCHGWGERAWHLRPIYCVRCNGRGRVRKRIKETPEQRWARMRAWVAGQIKPEEAEIVS